MYYGTHWLNFQTRIAEQGNAREHGRCCRLLSNAEALVPDVSFFVA
jgi:hypothetical protein